MKKKNSPKKV